MQRAASIILRLIGILLIISGIYTALICLPAGAGGAHLSFRVEQATEPIIKEILAKPRNLETSVQLEQDMKKLVDAVYVFVDEANYRAFMLAIKATGVGIFQGIVGFILLGLTFYSPKMLEKHNELNQEIRE